MGHRLDSSIQKGLGMSCSLERKMPDKLQEIITCPAGRLRADKVLGGRCSPGLRGRQPFSVWLFSFLTAKLECVITMVTYTLLAPLTRDA